ncbi:MAG TPA: Ig-like domain-containing protein, partial [Gemmatimonadaceae bacterium]|nr:Ig-like domain-containing protein [Gemmatimonadaceae bacterium]
MTVVARTHIGRTAKIVAATLSAATAAVSIFGFARSYGLVGAPAPLALTVGELGVTWVGVSPAADTAFAIGDTLQLAATVIDKNGTALVGATLHWSSDNPAIVEAIGGGKVVAKGAGTTTVVAAVGEKLARSRVTVRQRVTTVRADGDSALVLAEDERRPLPVRAFDARGYAIARPV